MRLLGGVPGMTRGQREILLGIRDGLVMLLLMYAIVVGFLLGGGGK